MSRIPATSDGLRRILAMAHCELPPRAHEQLWQFHQLLRESKLKVAAVVANRVNPDFQKGARLTRADTRAAADKLDVPKLPGLPPLGERLWQTLRDMQVLAGLDREVLKVLARRCEGTPVLAVPRFDHDIHDLTGLNEVGQQLRTAQPVAP